MKEEEEENPRKQNKQTKISYSKNGT